jgi:hypothetical protein
MTSLFWVYVTGHPSSVHKLEKRGRLVVLLQMYRGADKSLARRQEGNSSLGTCNPEENGLPGLPLS